MAVFRRGFLTVATWLLAMPADAIRKRSSLRARAGTPPSFLIMSSPTERKVSYGIVEGHEAASKIVKPLVDAGLLGPYGVALDTERSYLYVADSVQHKIFHYQLKVEEHYDSDTQISDYALAVDGYPTCVAQDVTPAWLAVDPQGDLFFSNDDPPSIDKLALPVIEMLVNGNIAASSLDIRTERETESTAAGDGDLAGTESNAASYKTAKPIISRLYEQATGGDDDSCSGKLAAPGGIVTNGKEIWWTNQKNGFTDGCVVRGKATVMPAASSGVEASSHCPHKVANNTGNTYGLVVTNTLVIYTSGTYVYATSRTTGASKKLSDSVFVPRGLAWDNSNTLFVADREGNCIWSLPCGQLRENAPLTSIFDFHDPFGLALLPGAKAAKVLQTIVKDDGGAATGPLLSAAQTVQEWLR